MTTSYHDIKGFPHSNNLLKKVVCVGGKSPAMLVVLEEPIVKELAIDGECWLEQIPMMDGNFSHECLELADNQMEDRASQLLPEK